MLNPRTVFALALIVIVIVGSIFEDRSPRIGFRRKR